MDKVPIVSTSQALGKSFSLIMLITVQGTMPRELFERGPALDGGDVERVGLHPGIDDDA